MKVKILIIIFSLFLLITMVSAMVVFLTEEKQPVLNEKSSVAEKQAESISNGQIQVATTTPKQIIQSEKAELPKIVNNKSGMAEEKVKAVLIVSGNKYEAAIKPGSSAYDLMNALKEQKKIDFKSNNYSGLGVFIEEINGVRNNQGGMNWLYYVNGQPAKIGVSYYMVKANDVIEWKYEKKSF